MLWLENGENGEGERLHCRTVTASTRGERQEALRKLREMCPQVAQIARRHRRVFSPPEDTPLLRSVHHSIRLMPGAQPVRRAPYPVGEVKREAMTTQVGELAEKGWVTPSESPWGAPVLFVKKKEGSWRLCIDFRDLNAVTVDDSFPLPRVEVLLHRAGSASVFSKLDLASGFHQISLASESRPLTAFRLPEPVKGCGNGL